MSKEITYREVAEMFHDYIMEETMKIINEKRPYLSEGLKLRLANRLIERAIIVLENASRIRRQRLRRTMEYYSRRKNLRRLKH